MRPSILYGAVIATTCVTSQLPISAQQYLSEPPFTDILPTDVDWKSPSSKTPLSTIVKLRSGFDGSVDYAVFDRDWLNHGDGTETGAFTKWTVDSLQGQLYIKSGCGLLACPFGRIRDSRNLPSPVTIGLGDQQYQIYGDEGAFVLPSAFITQLSQSSDSTSLSIKLGESGRVLPIGGKTVAALKKLYSVTSAKDPAPPFSLAAIPTSIGIGFERTVAKSLGKVVGIKAGSSSGTGFVADPSGLIFTNRHVVGSTRKAVDISYADGSQTKADIIYRDREKDLGKLWKSQLTRARMVL
jgi:hypothetical protein